VRTMRALIVLAVLGGPPSASALTSQPARFLYLRQIAIIGPQLVVRRSGPAYRYQARDYRLHGPRQYRQHVTPQTRAAPMARVPQVAPLSPRVGQ
jgi:hypothetical protein